jgi:hypothetical protein
LQECYQALGHIFEMPFEGDGMGRG